MQNIYQKKQTIDPITAATAGDTVPLDGAVTFSAQVNVTVPTAKNFAQGTRQVQTIDTVADVAGSLNDTYFLLNSINTDTEAAKGFYVWFNVDDGGTDPEIPDLTGIEIAISEDDTADDVATAIRTALDLLTDDFATTTGTNEHVQVNNKNPGPVTAAADGDAATGFTFNAPGTAGVASGVSVLNDTISIANHGYLTGNVVQASSTGTLPTGITTTTNYYVIKVDTNTIQLAASLEDAEEGVAIDLTTFGSNAGVGTLTPTALSGASVKLQKSNDGTTWTDEGSATNITATGTIWLEKASPTGAKMRLYFAISGGTLWAESYVLAKGER